MQDEQMNKKEGCQLWRPQRRLQLPQLLSAFDPYAANNTPIEPSFVSLRSSLVSAKYPHLQPIVQQSHMST